MFFIIYFLKTDSNSSRFSMRRSFFQLFNKIHELFDSYIWKFECWNIGKNIQFSKSFLRSPLLESAWEKGLEILDHNVSKSLLLVFSCFVLFLNVLQIGGTFSLFNALPEFIDANADLLKFWEVSSWEDQSSVGFILEDDVSVAALSSVQNDVLLIVFTEESGVGADNSQFIEISQSWTEFVTEFAWEFDWVESYCVVFQNFAQSVESIRALLLKSVNVELDGDWFVFWVLDFWENVFSQNSGLPVFE